MLYIEYDAKKLCFQAKIKASARAETRYFLPFWDGKTSMLAVAFC
jgi:hypothetical protein